MKHCMKSFFGNKVVVVVVVVSSESVKFTEVKDKELLKAAPKGRMRLIFTDNS